MKLPPKAYWTLQEAAMRWGCQPSDIAGWSIAGSIEIITGISPVNCGDEMVAGLVGIPAAEILPLFRRGEIAPATATVRRVRRPGEEEWLMITDPPEGVPIAAADVLIASDELERFEHEHGLLAHSRRWGPGPEARYDWDGMIVHLCRRLYEMGLPETQAELVGEMQEWFGRRGKAMPDDRSIRRRVTPIWRALREGE